MKTLEIACWVLSIIGLYLIIHQIIFINSIKGY